MLVNHRHAVNYVAINRYHVTGMGYHDVACLDFVKRNLNLNAILIQPDEPGLLAEGTQQHFLGVVLGLFDQHPSKRKADTHDRTGENFQGGQTAQYNDGVQHVYAQTFLLGDDFIGSDETGNGGIGKQDCGSRHQYRGGKLGDTGQGQ